MTTGSGALMSFLRKKHTFCLLTEGSDMRRRKYGSTLDPDQTKRSTLPNNATAASEPCHSRVWKK
jgi:hypothetical protein